MSTSSWVMQMLLYLGPMGARDLESDRPYFRSWLSSLLAVWLWTSHIKLPETQSTAL